MQITKICDKLQCFRKYAASTTTMREIQSLVDIILLFLYDKPLAL